MQKGVPAQIATGRAQGGGNLDLDCPEFLTREGLGEQVTILVGLALTEMLGRPNPCGHARTFKQLRPPQVRRLGLFDVAQHHLVGIDVDPSQRSRYRDAQGDFLFRHLLFEDSGCTGPRTV